MEEERATHERKPTVIIYDCTQCFANLLEKLKYNNKAMEVVIHTVHVGGDDAIRKGDIIGVQQLDKAGLSRTDGLYVYVRGSTICLWQVLSSNSCV
jgi:hypothetical protein